MSRGAFFTGLTLVIFYAVLTGLETSLESQLDRAVQEQKMDESRLATAQRVDRFAALLVRHAGAAAENDPQLVQMLKNHGLDLIIATPDQLPDQIRKEVDASKKQKAPTPLPAAPAP